MNRLAVVILSGMLFVGASVSASPLDTITIKTHPPNITNGTMFLWGGPVKGGEAIGGIYRFDVSTSDPPTGEGALLVRDPATGLLDAFCIELLQDPPTSFSTFQVVMPEDAPIPGDFIPGPMGHQKQEELRELWGRYFGTAKASGGAAEVFSACVWEIVYEDNDTVWDVTTLGSADGRGFRCTGADTTLANTWLGSLDGTGPLANLRGLTNTEDQDFLAETPEPATVTLLVLGGGALALIHGRRRK